MTESVTALCPPIVLGVEEERLRRKQRASAAFRLFAQMGFDHGVTGHVTVRDPQFPELFWVNFIVTVAVKFLIPDELFPGNSLP